MKGGERFKYLLRVSIIRKLEMLRNSKAKGASVTFNKGKNNLSCDASSVKEMRDELGNVTIHLRHEAT